MKKLYFVRHGLSELNAAGRVAGSIDTPLLDEGRTQARKAGEGARNLNIDCIVCSPLSRAHETAQIIAGQIGYPIDKIIINDLLKERDNGSKEGAPWPLSEADIAEAVGYEHDHLLIARAQKALDFINSLPAENILIVSHGATGKALRHLLTGNPLDHRLMIPNAHILAWVEEQ